MLSRLLRPPKASFFLVGPRGTGKSTWIRANFPSAKNYDLLRTHETIRFAREPGILRQELEHSPRGSWVVIDEIQKVPALLDEVHALMEDHQIKFVLSGSSTRKLKRGAANLLAGRARTERMFPLVSKELGNEFRVDQCLTLGSLPVAFASDDPQAVLASYAETYLREEIYAEALTRNLGGFARFLEIAARQNGQVTNVASIARDAQVARQTVQGYFEVLVDTLVGFYLEAWKLKRSTKQVAHPKFYFFDAGVARALSDRLAYPPTNEEIGFQLETLVLHELRAYLSYRRLRYPTYFWSSHDGVEVDIFLEDQRGYLAIEIKSASRWEARFSRGLMRIRDELKGVRTIGVFRGPRLITSHDSEILPVEMFLQRLWGDALIH